MPPALFTLTLQLTLPRCPFMHSAGFPRRNHRTPQPSGRYDGVSSPLGSILSHDHGRTLVGYGSDIRSGRINPSGFLDLTSSHHCVTVRHRRLAVTHTGISHHLGMYPDSIPVNSATIATC